ncbi:MAG: hypothetical protein L3J79_05835, partial [Candidatus Marinimicrobia bacterium]|nr:hypothetical protein [Candidatus Neomarinimicrobiota bacterium]
RTGYRPLILLVALGLLMISSLRAQLISLKTIPVAAGDQFLLFPSQNLGIGGVSISLSDSLADPWVNPAYGNKIKGRHVFIAPVYYRIANGMGSARSMPFSVQWSQGVWFAGGGLAIQTLNTDENPTFWQPGARTLSGNSAENKYFAGFLGKRLTGLNSSIALGVYWADLSALGGVDLLYNNSQKIVQDGDISDIRIGFVRESQQGVSQEILFIRNEVDLLHEVSYRRGWGEEQIEQNLDHTVTLGLHLGIQVPLNNDEWKYGGLFTVNHKSHPKIPNYEIMNIPRDPGNTMAYNLGVGLSKRAALTTFGVDIIYEPIWSNTWAEADTFMVNLEDQLIRPGDKTIENDFKFSNWIMRTGLGWKKDHQTFQLGLQMRTIQYTLDQQDYLAVTQRQQQEYWSEWTTTWGVTFEYPEYTIRYSGRTTTGTGRPGVDTQWIWFGGALEASVGGDYIIAPSDDLTLEAARVITHQISIAVPIGK